MRSVELIIFDLDGTLIDSRQDIKDAVNFTLRELGLPQKSLSEVTSYIGMGVKSLISQSLGGGQEALLEKALSIFEGYYRQHSTGKSVLYPGVKEVLEYFKRKKKIIITNRNREFAVPVLKATGIYDYFTDIIGGDDTECMKPSPCPLNKFTRGLDINKEKTIIVGDMDIDILTGRRAGVITCAVTYGIGKREDILKARPDYIIDDLWSLKGIIN